MAVVAGMDSCSGGWLYLARDLATGKLDARILAHIGAILTLGPHPGILAVDIPIGLPEAGPRDCDREARAQLRAPRASSVFPAPIRAALGVSSYEEACQIGQRTDGRKLSRQTWAILPKIRQVDRFLRSNPSLQTWIREVHPEVCFWRWNNGRAMNHSKKTRQGRAERERLVVARFGPAYSSAQASLPRDRYANDDLLDAFAALWSAERIRKGEAIVLPRKPPLDKFGLRMEINA